MKNFLSICFLLITAFQARSQYFQFSQYDLASARVTPTAPALTDYASLGFIYRNQGTASEITLNSNLVSATYPLINRTTGRRWSGLGMTLMDDRSGGLFKIQEATLSYAGNIFLSESQSLQLGLKGLYQQRTMNLDELSTGMQYVADRGFDRSLPSGEGLGVLRGDFFTLSSGISWQNVNRDGVRTAYASVAIFDLNKVSESFGEGNFPLHETLVAQTSFRLLKETNLSLFPEMLFTRNASLNQYNVGLRTRCDVRGTRNSKPFHVDVLTRYVVDRSGIFGLQFHNETFSLGFSYDALLKKENVSNIGAFEVALEIRQLVRPILKTKTEKKSNVRPLTTAAPKQPNQSRKSQPAAEKPAVEKKSANPSVTETLLNKRDSAIALVEKQGKVELDHTTLHFTFESNSSELDLSSVRYLDELADALKQDSRITVELNGHTDNVGSASFNQRLSALRANSVKDYLVSKGVDASRITATGKGMAEPLNGNKTESDRALNRRVEVRVLYQ